MTRKLVDVAQDVIVHAEDCATSNGITVHAIYDGDEEVASLASRIYGRTSCERIADPSAARLSWTSTTSLTKSRRNNWKNRH